MARHSHPALAGLAPLGARLKELRAKAGISQMKLAGRIGFDPTHGYKYILRLEKGLVPNPTLRTIAAFLEACGASWTDLTDVLPSTGDETMTRTTPTARPEPKPEPEPAPVIIEPAPEPRRRDARPVREQLRQHRIREQEARSRRYWQRVAEAEEDVHALLRSAHVVPARHRDYLLFARNCCSLISTHPERPGAAAPAIAELRKSTAVTGLEPALLERIADLCLAALTAPDKTG